MNVYNTFVFVEDVYKVEKCAEKLKKEGYSVKYTFDDFDEMGKSIKKGTLYLSILVAMLLIISINNLIMSFVKYLNIQQKDMGILKFHGFSDGRIYNIYIRNINIIFIGISIIMIIYMMVVGYMLLGFKYFVQYLVMTLIMILIIMVINVFVRCRLKKIVKKDIMYMVKCSKEFE